ncbi:hypothetical protein EI983_16840 [Roseovarius faecimaris]|uniref:Phospholipase/carboxylesterase/thioesterase domain-containing protein n=1 Tax=Roseovarius faecimaris TaxID=2494550 RepID=A0A6I6IT03_9RHOB|nr:PHB depolymerase family esterase [Roseovarius faecimaris]QGX99845.1 hypothetical protein EI983_16840 [Roseovarius faecimaris]
MKRLLVLSLALVTVVSVLGCQRASRLPEIISRSTGIGSTDRARAPAPVPSSYGSSNYDIFSDEPLPGESGYVGGARTGGTQAVTTPVMGRPSSVGQMEARSIVVGGQQRSYYVYAPASARRGQPAPMVLAFHGGGGGADGFVERMNLRQMADRYGMVLVAPQGLGRKRPGRGSWNAESVSAGGYAENAGVDDVGFVDALLRNVPGDYAIDRNRIYAMGFSKGGMMAYRAACVLRGQITAVAAVAATVSSANCPYPQGVSVLHIHGTSDQNVPLNGGIGAMTAAANDWPPVSRGLSFFTNGNQCSGAPQTLRVSSDTSCTVNSCGNGETVQLCLVQGGGHAWPGAEPARWQVKRNVKVTQSFSATDYIARFFQSH